VLSISSGAANSSSSSALIAATRWPTASNPILEH
jgi:hypothetical protein